MLGMLPRYAAFMLRNRATTLVCRMVGLFALHDRASGTGSAAVLMTNILQPHLAARVRLEAQYDLKGSLQMMLDGMAEQDEAWEKHVAQASQTSSKEEFEQLLAHANGRMEAQRRLKQLKVICDAR